MLAVEAPYHGDLLARHLATLTFEIVVGRERFTVRGLGGRCVATTDRAERSDVTITSTLATCRDLLAGRTTVLAAIRARRLDLRGSIGALRSAARALDVFLHGLVRAPSAPRLLEEFGMLTTGERP